MDTPVEVREAVPSVARAMPKSIRRGPSRVRRTLDGFTSRWTRPSSCTAASASPRPAPSARTEWTGSGPPSATAAVRDGPAAYAVATHGTRASGSASRTGAVQAPPTRRAAATSRRNRARNSSSSAKCGCTIFTATVRPPALRPR
ncbi:hypothetical protein STENM327S_08259 [Streptomyces tendae]